MFHVEPIMIDNHKVTAIEVKLPKTTLIIVTTEKGYIMCGAHDICREKPFNIKGFSNIFLQESHSGHKMIISSNLSTASCCIAGNTWL
ncbi:hypothetical protein SAMN05443246_2424 [Paenibacillus sp. GP183]|nr:hypothetical protein SAMN05443246_2424 [Paenibacillus sp. GP183]